MTILDSLPSWMWKPRTSIAKKTGYVVVMGMTGSGKTTFISHLASPGGRPVAGHSLKSSTFGTSRYRVQVPTNLRARVDDIVLVDTPGFDDTTRSDIDILRTIADELHELQGEGGHLLGVIFLHRITDMRLTSSAIKNITVLQKICGKDNYEKVFLATTMWDLVSCPEEARNSANTRQKELEEYWKELFGEKSMVQPYEPNTQGSAWDVVKRMLNEPPCTLQIQTELLNRGLEWTEAGKYLCRGLLDDEKQQELDKKQQELYEKQQELVASRNSDAESLNESGSWPPWFRFWAFSDQPTTRRTT